MRGYYLLRAVLVRWGAGEQKHGVGPGDWETEEMEAWEKGGRKGTSVAVAYSRPQMVQRAAKARQRRQRKEQVDEARRNKDEAKARREEERAQRAECRVRRDQEKGSAGQWGTAAPKWSMIGGGEEYWRESGCGGRGRCAQPNGHRRGGASGGCVTGEG